MQLLSDFHGDWGVSVHLVSGSASILTRSQARSLRWNHWELDIQTLEKNRDAAISQKVALFHCSLQAHISSHKDASESVLR